jgi:sulfur-carrier protein
MRVTIPSPLLSYTTQRDVVAQGATLAAVLHDLDRQYPGLRFRMVDEQNQIRPHMRVFLGSKETRDLGTVLEPAMTVHIVQALSGG